MEKNSHGNTLKLLVGGNRSLLGEIRVFWGKSEFAYGNKETIIICKKANVLVFLPTPWEYLVRVFTLHAFLD
jgi:hypothetical protein